MPRLSVDIDLVYIDHTKTREEAFTDISNAVNEICKRLNVQGLSAKIKPSGSQELDSKIIVESNGITVKIEINHVMRGVVSQIENISITQAVQDRFKTKVTVPMLSKDEVYAGKLVAAMDRQHPRDLFDVYQLMDNEGISGNMINIFVAYLACHNRPIHEVLFGNMSDIKYEYENNFVGMTTADIGLKTLTDTREKMFNVVRNMLTADQKQFLISLTKAEPEWPLIGISHLPEMPGMTWKLKNLNILKTKNPAKLAAQVDLLEKKFAEIRPHHNN